MAVVRMIIDRPVLARTVSAVQFADPLGSLAAEGAVLAQALGRLDRLAEGAPGTDPDMAVRCAGASGLLDYFRYDLPLYLEDEIALLERVERAGSAVAMMAEIRDVVQQEHAMAWRLLRPVTEGLEEIAITGSALQRERFAVAVLVLSTFLRMHADYVAVGLMPLANATLGADDMAPLGREMAYRRGLDRC